MVKVEDGLFTECEPDDFDIVNMGDKVDEEYGLYCYEITKEQITQLKNHKALYSSLGGEYAILIKLED